MGLCLNWIARFDAETDCKLGFLLNPSLGFISKIGSEKGHSFSSLLPPPSTLHSLFNPHHSHFCLFASSLQRLHSPFSPSLVFPKINLWWKWWKMLIMGLLEKHKVKVTLHSPPHTPTHTLPRSRSHRAWRQWDARATNHLYTLISASGPRRCLLLSEQMTFRKKSELGREGWGGCGEGQFTGVREDVCGSWNWEGNCVRHMSSCAKDGFHCTPTLCVSSVTKWTIWVVYWITFTIVCVPGYYHWKSYRKCGAHIVCSQRLVIFVSHVSTHSHTPFPPPRPGARQASWFFCYAECILHALRALGRTRDVARKMRLFHLQHKHTSRKRASAVLFTLCFNDLPELRTNDEGARWKVAKTGQNKNNEIKD